MLPPIGFQINLKVWRPSSCSEAESERVQNQRPSVRRRSEGHYKIQVDSASESVAGTDSQGKQQLA